MPEKGDLKKWSNYGRTISLICAIAYPVLGLYCWVTSLTSGGAVFCTFISPLVGIIEMPTCCTCFTWCKVVDKYSRFLTRFWITRALIYIGISAAFYSIYSMNKAETSMFLMVPNVGLDVAALFYIIATFTREPVPTLNKGTDGASELTDERSSNNNKGSGNGKDDGDAAARAASGLFGFLAKNPKAAKAVVGAAAAAPSMGQKLFGGSSDGDEEHGRPASSADPFMSSSSSASSNSGAQSNGGFGGGGLFGGAKSKYGYASDAPEANPFVG